MNWTAQFSNPFANSIVPGILLRLAIIYGVAIAAILIAKRGNLRAVWSSNIGRRIIGWLILTPLYFVGVFAGGIPGLAVLSLFIIGAVLEYGRIAKLDNRFRMALVLLSVASVLIAGFKPSYFYSLPLLYFVVVTPLAIRQNQPDKSFESAAVTMYGAIWLIFSLCHLVLLVRLSRHFDMTYALPFLVIFAVALADIGGYVVGKLFHRFGILDNFKVADELSPNKTYIGTLGYIIGAYLSIVLFHFAVGSYMTNLQWLIVAVIIGVFSFVGGLTHSYFKRYYGVKDSGHIIPGHGGVMDRIDSISRVGVILYYFLTFFIIK